MPLSLGIFARTFPRPTLEETLDAIAALGLTHVQFNLSRAGLSTLPDHLEPERCDAIALAFRDRGLSMAAISGTFNLIRPFGRFDSEPNQGQEIFQTWQILLRRFEGLAAACRRLGTSIITLCTGTHDPVDMWRWHPDNGSRSTWAILVHRLSDLARIASRYEVTLAFEPETNNVVDSCCKARRLLDEVGSPWVKVVLDPANLVRAHEAERQRGTLVEAIDWLGNDVALVHVKELGRDGRSGNLAPGEGILDYAFWIQLIEQTRYQGPLIMHGLPEACVGHGIAHMEWMGATR
jgi:sugar phosphate isomerase/epimerase